MPKAPRIGEPAPEFSARAHDGRTISLASYRGSRNVVLYFYPKDFTRVCTAETCGFRDMYADLASKDTEVIGVSLDSDASHQKFAAEYGVTFPLLADPARLLADKFGAAGLLRGILGLARRVTYVIDKQGIIREILDSELSADAHLKGVTRALAKL